MTTTKQSSDAIETILLSYGYWFGDKIRGQLHDTPHMTLKDAYQAIENLLLESRIDELRNIDAAREWVISAEIRQQTIGSRIGELQSLLNKTGESE